MGDCRKKEVKCDNNVQGYKNIIGLILPAHQSKEKSPNSKWDKMSWGAPTDQATNDKLESIAEEEEYNA